MPPRANVDVGGVTTGVPAALNTSALRTALTGATDSTAATRTVTPAMPTAAQFPEQISLPRWGSLDVEVLGIGEECAKDDAKCADRPKQ